MDSDLARSNGQLHGPALLAALKKVAPSLIGRKLANEAVRLWVPGCATGELAYAVACLLHDLAQQRSDPLKLQVYATDSDTRAIEVARRGWYSEPQTPAVLSEQQAGLFQNEQQRYPITMAVRHTITFAEHVMLRDPPFGSLDLLICDNLLAKFPGQVEQILHQFHWSLKPGGYLLLGAGAGSAVQSELFVQHRTVPSVFQRKRVITPEPLRLGDRELARQPLADESFQIVNEQLLAMNHALRRKIGRLTQASDDLDNLMRAIDLAIVFLDRHLHITRFTPQAQELFNLLPADRGRPFGHISHTLDYDTLPEDAAKVLASLQGIEREVRGADSRWHLVRLIPYRTTEDRIDGVVLICLDITARVEAQAAIQRSHDELELRVRERTEELSTVNSQLQIEIAQRARLEQERTELLRKLVTTQEDERRRIARELHDQFSQTVTAFSLGLGALSDSMLGMAQRQQTLEHLRQLATQIDQDMGRLALDLRPTALDDLGLVPALQHHIESWSEHTGISAEIQLIGLEIDQAPPELASVIYRVVQEALTNVVKHAAAANVSIILERQREQMRVIVEDDGCGFDLDALEQVSSVQRRLGLLGMRERVALVGGTLTIESTLGTGTTLFVHLPISPQSLEQADGA